MTHTAHRITITISQDATRELIQHMADERGWSFRETLEHIAQLGFSEEMELRQKEQPGLQAAG